MKNYKAIYKSVGFFQLFLVPKSGEAVRLIGQATPGPSLKRHSGAVRPSFFYRPPFFSLLIHTVYVIFFPRKKQLATRGFKQGTFQL